MKSSFDFYWFMPLPLRTIDPSRLVARRVELGLTRAALAARAGVSPRMIFFYEEGRHTPTPPRLEQLAAALGCEADALTGAPRGQESLVDLRYAAGLTLDRVAELLRASSAGRELCVSAPKISALENGRQVRGRHWEDPEATGRLLTPLAKAYGVPVRMVLDAWMRTRVDEPAPVLADRRKREPSRAAQATWESLNERQQVYLGEIMRDDRMTATEMWMRRVQRLAVPRAAEWRKLPLTLKAGPSAVGYTRLQERLRQRGVHDPGAGQTVHALERRGLLVITEDTVEHPVGGEVGRVLVEITKRGRAAARAGLGEASEPEPGAHLLSEWLWGVLSRVAAAEPTGLDDDRLAGRSLFFIGVGYAGKPGGQPSRGLVDSVPVLAPGGTHVAEYRWRLTQLGRRHVVEYLDVYRELYPRTNTTGLDGLMGGTR
ncbi:helix-turn-helix domain-containing protein [Streptacidiphilus sp. P02-A3a]|uniref:helix-turn-helix domain-containing protein n=1 Tax=Streptacidiphilus sp. P02-A3a TaxID=2704468 RepID=UPI0015FBC94B|nr:helix-turn-helix transcriptional regulator [Streptacidiphilus sp. P02-A3a]QMU67110.1 helix-turn-helix transcriptional regulator [Streptacidiphilus sp. P02-A3a]